MHPKRLRLFAGPNGSGKTTILERIPRELNLGFIVNADDIEKTMKSQGKFQLNEQNITTNTQLLQNYFKNEGFSTHKIADHNYIESIQL